MRVLVDMDGVLADFERGFLTKWRARYPDKLSIPIAERTDFYILDQYPSAFSPLIKEIMYEPGFIRELRPIPGAIEAMEAMVAAGIEVFICSSPFTRYEHCVEEKYAWVDAHLGFTWVPRIILAKDKTLINGDVLIDDRPVVDGVAEPSWEHVVFDQPYNRAQQEKRRLRRWEEWRQVLIPEDGDSELF
jgi:5'-nucleotidase